MYKIVIETYVVSAVYAFLSFLIQPLQYFHMFVADRNYILTFISLLNIYTLHRYVSNFSRVNKLHDLAIDHFSIHILIFSLNLIYFRNSHMIHLLISRMDLCDVYMQVTSQILIYIFSGEGNRNYHDQYYNTRQEITVAGILLKQ